MRKAKRTEYNPYSIGECIANTANVSTTFALTYSDENNNTQTFCSGINAADILHRFNDRVYLYQVIPNRTEEQELADAAAKFAAEYAAWWGRRGTEWARLLMAFKKEYDPISNYDRHEEGGWSDTNAQGARSGTHNLTDSYATFTDTETVTPTVKTKETVTPTVKTKETVTPSVKTKETVTPGVTETTTETPRVAMETVTTPGTSDTTAKDVYADNSSTPTPAERTILSHTGYDTVTVTPTTGTNSTVVGRTGTNETVNEILSGDTQTVNEVVSGNTETVNEVVSGNTQTQTVKGAHIDTHNTSTSENAVTDTLTRLFSDYHVFGNIGVTTSAQMLTGELELRSADDIVTFALVEFVNLMTIYL